MAKTAARRTRKPNPAAAEAARAERAGFEEAVDAVEAELTEEDLFAIAGRFPQYSVKNNIMIYLQNPAATVLYTFKSWQGQGRQVLRGEKGIRIWAPAGKAEDETDAAGKVTKEGRQFFKLISVFDVAQTEDAAILARQAAEPGREQETVWCENPNHGEPGTPHFQPDELDRDDCVHPHYTDQVTRARMNRELVSA